MAEYAFTGMGALIAALERLPDELRQEADGVVHATADLMAADVRAAYEQHRHTGNLAEHVVVEKGAPAGGELRARVKSTARHAHMFERGTVQRFRASNGANRGTMPAANVFIPRAIKHREEMVRRLIGIVRKVRIPGMTGVLEVVER